MSFLRFELDAFSGAAIAAGLLGVPARNVSGGLLELWAWCWREGRDTASPAQIAGALGVPDRALAVDALEAGGFVERLGDCEEVRVRGASGYLRIAEQRAAAGRRGAAKRKQTSSKPTANRQQKASVDPRSEIRDPKEPESEAKAAAAAAVPPAGSDEQAVKDFLRVDALQGLWNDLAVPAGLPAWKETGRERERKAKARLRERPLDTDRGWGAVIAKIAASAFCRGQNDRGWRASPDWLLEADTAAKVLEGKYDDRAATGPPRDVRKGPIRAEDVSWAGEKTGPVDWDKFMPQEKPHG